MRPQIRLAGGTPDEVRVQGELESLLDRLPLDRFAITSSVVIEDGVVPHSHPVLTLGTTSPHEAALLSSYLHEQLHWWSVSCPGAVDRREEVVLEALRARFDLPTEPPHGCGSERSNVIHLHVCWLELEALATLFGDEWAVARLRGKPYYRAVYAAVTDERAYLADLFNGAGMGLPPEAPGVS